MFMLIMYRKVTVLCSLCCFEKIWNIWATAFCIFHNFRFWIYHPSCISGTVSSAVVTGGATEGSVWGAAVSERRTS